MAAAHRLARRATKAGRDALAKGVDWSGCEGVSGYEAVAELKERIEGSDALLLTEYRGLTVSEIGELRRSLGLETGIAKRREHKPGKLTTLAKRSCRRVVRHCVSRARLHSRCTVCRAQSQLVQPSARGEERFIGQNPRC